MKNIYILLSFYILPAAAQSPEITSWILNSTDTGFGGILSNVQQVQYSDQNVYISATCIPGYDIGPWAGNPNTPANQNFVYKITRSPMVNVNTPTATGLGHIGVFTNGVSIFNPRDGMSYNNQNVWQQNAIVVEGPSFDSCLGHPAGNGEYHHHLNPTCLYDDTISDVHAPIVGYAFDGFPVYGAYGFANADGTGGIKRMQSSYDLRDISVRSTLPNGNAAASAGPAVSTAYPLGYYIQDFVYNAGSGDLDQHNGRFCVTPEYPAGQYCYFITLDENLIAEYPYVIGPTYYGTVQPGNTGPGSGHNVISESVTTYTGGLAVADNNSISYQVYPIPASDFININVGQDMPNDLSLEIADNSGRVVYRQNFIQPTILYAIDVSQFASGVYFVNLHSNDRKAVQKIVIE